MKPFRVCLAAAFLAAVTAGCKSGGPSTSATRPAGSTTRPAEATDNLPVEKLVLISPHNQDIEREFEEAFSAHHARAHGSRVDLEWRDVGGGGSKILEYLRNVYSRAPTSGIDLVFGGGDFNHQALAAEGLLERLDLGPDVLKNVPALFGGIEMYDKDHRWCGAVISGFGFLYNSQMLQRLHLRPPTRWEDLGGKDYFDLVALSDPTQSGSAAAAYEMIVQSGKDWPDGWGRLLAVLSNSRKFYDAASGAADAPVLGEAPVAACIDFYGATRVAAAPDTLVYVSPRGQTAFSPDPIAILKNPPHPELARRFVDFVLSARGQALWALRVGEADGPTRTPLGRQPIRKDVYSLYAGRMSPWIVNPYEGGKEMVLDVPARELRFGMLRQLIRAAAMDNREALHAAKKRLIETAFEPARLAEFNRLPENVSSADKIAETVRNLKDPTRAERITTDWQTFFRENYRRVAQ